MAGLKGTTGLNERPEPLPWRMCSASDMMASDVAVRLPVRNYDLRAVLAPISKLVRPAVRGRVARWPLRIDGSAARRQIMIVMTGPPERTAQYRIDYEGAGA